MPSMYAVSVGVFTRQLTNLLAQLEKAEAYAAERKFKVETLVHQRIFWDMAPLSFQVQNATDHAKGGAARLAGRELPSWPDTEKTFEELKGRIRKALDYLSTFKPEDIDGSENKVITLKRNGEDYTMSGQDFLLGRAQQNFWFHVTTAYNILRANGVPIGKSDYTK
jgi:hypothetical protein